MERFLWFAHDLEVERTGSRHLEEAFQVLMREGFAQDWQSRQLLDCGDGECRPVVASLTGYMEVIPVFGILTGAEVETVDTKLEDLASVTAVVAGVGGGTMPLFLHSMFAQSRVICVDVDARVFEVARDYFHLPSERVESYVMDARAFFEEKTSVWAGATLVVLDLFDSTGRSPSYLGDIEFLRHLKRYLAVGGAVVVNLVEVAWHEVGYDYWQSTLSAFSEVFPTNLYFRADDGNVALSANTRLIDYRHQEAITASWWH